MSNPIYTTGPISFEAASRVEKGHLVAINKDGKVEHAAAEGPVFGAVTDIADPEDILRPNLVSVFYGSNVVKLVTKDESIAAGAAVFAAADGEAAASGSVQVGVAIAPAADGAVKVALNGLPYAAAASAPAAGA